MFRYLWRNPFYRAGILFAFFLILFSLIFPLRKEILFFIDSILYSPLYSDPSTWEEGVGFVEDPKKALDLYVSSLKEIRDIVEDLYEIEEEFFFRIDPSLERTWQDLLSSSYKRAFSLFFHDVALFCSLEEGFKEEKLKQRTLRKDPSHPFDYAISEKKYPSLVEDLEDLLFYELFYALERKPDAIGPLFLKRDIALSLCHPSLVWEDFLKALEYRENTLLKGKEEIPIEKRRGLLNKDEIFSTLYKEYQRLLSLLPLKASFLKEEKLRAYFLTREYRYLKEYWHILEKMILQSSPEEAKGIYYHLFFLPIASLEKDPFYVYLLFLSSFYAKLYRKALFLGKNFLYFSFSFEDPLYKKKKKVENLVKLLEEGQ